MTRRLFGPVSGPLAFFLVAALVFAGLGWVTYSALGVERSQRESRPVPRWATISRRTLATR